MLVSYTVLISCWLQIDEAADRYAFMAKMLEAHWTLDWVELSKSRYKDESNARDFFISSFSSITIDNKGITLYCRGHDSCLRSFVIFSHFFFFWGWGCSIEKLLEIVITRLITPPISLKKIDTSPINVVNHSFHCKKNPHLLILWFS